MQELINRVNKMIDNGGDHDLYAVVTHAQELLNKEKLCIKSACESAMNVTYRELFQDESDFKNFKETYLSQLK